MDSRSDSKLQAAKALKNKLATLQDRLDNPLKDDYTALRQLEKTLPLSELAKKKFNMKTEDKVHLTLKQLRANSKPLTVSQIENYFLKWSERDYQNKNYVTIYELCNHFIKRELEINKNDIAYLSESLGYSSVIRRVFKKYNVRYKSFNTGLQKRNYHDDVDFIAIKVKKYALILK